MVEVVHTSNVRVIGGRVGHTESPDGNLDIKLKHPGTTVAGEPASNPEQLFAAAYAACFAGAMGGIARNEKLTLGEIVIDASASLVRTPDHVYSLTVRIDVISAGDFSQDQLANLVREADKTCPYSNATRGNIPVELFAAGQAI